MLQRLTMPHTLVVVMALVVIVLALSWAVPSGEYERTKIQTNAGERTVTVADTYREVPKIYLGIEKTLEAPIRGFVDAALLICFLLVIGGAFGVFQETGAVEFGITALTDAIACWARWFFPLMLILVGLSLLLLVPPVLLFTWE